MHYSSCTHETTRLDRESTVGVSLHTRNQSLQLVYRRHVKPKRRETTARRFGLGLILGAFIIAGALGYGMLNLGGMVLAALIVLAFYQAGRGPTDAND